MRLVAGDGTPVAPGRELDDDDLAALYPWPAGPWVRSMMLMTLDGATLGPDGRSKGLSSPADMRVFRETRRLADAVLIGASTMRAERYRPMLARDGRAPRLAVVSASLDLPWDEPVWRESAHRPLVLAPPSADAGRVASAREHADVVTLRDGTGAAVIEALAELGLRHVTCEGGARLLAALSRDGVVDEADLAIAPLLAGGGQVAAGEPQPPARLRLAHVLEEDGYLFTRFVR